MLHTVRADTVEMSDCVACSGRYLVPCSGPRLHLWLRLSAKSATLLYTSVGLDAPFSCPAPRHESSRDASTPAGWLTTNGIFTTNRQVVPLCLPADSSTTMVLPFPSLSTPVFRTLATSTCPPTPSTTTAHAGHIHLRSTCRPHPPALPPRRLRSFEHCAAALRATALIRPLDPRNRRCTPQLRR